MAGPVRIRVRSHRIAAVDVGVGGADGDPGNFHIRRYHRRAGRYRNRPRLRRGQRCRVGFRPRRKGRRQRRRRHRQPRQVGIRRQLGLPPELRRCAMPAELQCRILRVRPEIPRVVGARRRLAGAGVAVNVQIPVLIDVGRCRPVGGGHPQLVGLLARRRRRTPAFGLPAAVAVPVAVGHRGAGTDAPHQAANVIDVVVHPAGRVAGGYRPVIRTHQTAGG